MTDMEAVTRCVEDLWDLLEESELTERKAFVRSFVREVRVIGNEVLLTYTMPLPPDGKSEERVEVLDTVHYGGDRGIRTPDLCDANAARPRTKSPAPPGVQTWKVSIYAKNCGERN